MCRLEGSLYYLTYKRSICTTVKDAVFWNVSPCRSCEKLLFGGKCRLHLQGRKIRKRGTALAAVSQLRTLLFARGLSYSEDGGFPSNFPKIPGVEQCPACLVLPAPVVSYLSGHIQALYMSTGSTHRLHVSNGLVNRLSTAGRPYTMQQITATERWNSQR
jgi:hypothetical protein